MTGGRHWRRTLGPLVVAGLLVYLIGPPMAQAAVPRCFGERATIVGTNGDDTLRGTRAADVIVGLGGNDVIKARGGEDLICAGPGGDRVFAGWGADRVNGGSGRDMLWGRAGADRLSGGSGSDLLYGEGGPDKLRGGPGGDLLWGGRGVDDALLGESGGDELDGEGGDDVLDGGPGRDGAHFEEAPGPVDANLATGVATGWGTDSLVSIEDLHGADEFDNTLTGDDGPNFLWGGYGADTLVGGEVVRMNDVLFVVSVSAAAWGLYIDDPRCRARQLGRTAYSPAQRDSRRAGGVPFLVTPDPGPVAVWLRRRVSGTCSLSGPSESS